MENKVEIKVSADTAREADVQELADNRRRYRRCECLSSALVEIQTWRGLQRVDGIIHDASVKGLQLELGDEHILSEGDPITIRWKVPPALGYAKTTTKCVSRGVIVRARRNAKLPNIYGIRFDHILDSHLQKSTDRYQKAVIAFIAVLLGMDIVLLKMQNLAWFWYSPLFQGYSVIISLYIISKVFFSMLYREPKDAGYMPSVSVIISAKNEELHITQTIQHCFDARYPKGKLEVLAVDDGSTDTTWKVLSQLQLEYPMLTIHRFPQNRGKRHAMAYGAQKAKGDILIYIDSDSFIEPEGIYKLVQPFVDKRIGAVAGHCLVEVEPGNTISKMEAVRYYISQRIMKAAESIFGAVSCCPGPFSAYRKDVVLKFLPQWESQTFLGTPATFGDDRSLTNFILRTHRAVFHNGAVVRTYVPNNWKTFFKQQLRWKKSWARETVIASKFMWRMHPAAAIPYYSSIILTLMSPIVAVHALVYLPIFMSVSSLSYLAGLGLINIFMSTIYYYFTRSRYWYYSLGFGVLYIGFLSWQTYYAIFTVRRNHWGTR
jgi:hyaluronan synthase